jgi:hypothetical protein
MASGRAALTGLDNLWMEMLKKAKTGEKLRV